MNNDKGVVSLDANYSNNSIMIYEVDGKRGTLKELSDYFNVDPVSVSDLLLDGYSIQDALCAADKGFAPKKEVKEVKKVEKPVKKRGRIPVKSGVVDKPVMPEIDVEKVVVSYDEQPIHLTPNEVAYVKNDEKAVAALSSLLYTNSVSDVQDLGDVVIVTTTTTTVYKRKESK